MAAPRLDKLSNNILINGMMKYWQRGAALVASASGGSSAFFGADRWHVQNNTGQNMNMTREVDVPSWSDSEYSFKIGNSGALGDISAAVNNWTSFQQRVEGTMLQRVRSKPCTLVFSVKPTVTGNMTVSFYDASTSLVSHSVSLNAGVWQRKKILVDLSNGVFPIDNSIALYLHFALASSNDNEHGSVGIWVPQAVPLQRALTNQTNFFETAGQFVSFSDVMLVDGDFVTGYADDAFPEFAFAGRNLVEEFQLCQRYFEKSYALETSVGTTTTAGAYERRVITATERLLVHYSVEKRATPVVSYFNGDAVSAGTWRDLSGDNNITPNTLSTSNIKWFIASIAGVADNALMRGHWTADAEL